ncbi:MAG: hypothetical protein R3281_14370 [Balneolaceae bacterium]|nr:hypothetical protein [Balneolaceae bacterium]
MIKASYLEETLHSSAYVAGDDFEHGWNNRDWIVSGVFTGTTVRGTTAAITETQTNSTHYYNRVDADYLSVHKDRTYLNGYAGELSLSKSGGEHWLGSLTYTMASPGY